MLDSRTMKLGVLVAVLVAWAMLASSATAGRANQLCPDCYRIHLYAFPDGVGKGPYPELQGCDGLFTDADRAEAHERWLGAHMFIVAGSSGSRPIYSNRTLAPNDPNEWIRGTVILGQKPPFWVTMEDGGCWSLCPNSPATHHLTQWDFDRISGWPRGADRGRNIQVEWFLYDRCPPTPVP